METLNNMIVSLGFFSAVVLIIYLSIQARSRLNKYAHDERMLAIEKGVDIPMSPGSPDKKKNRNPLTWPFVFIAIGLAMVVGNIIEGDFELFWSLIPLFIGSAMLLAHYQYLKQHRTKTSSEEVEKLNSHSEDFS